MREQIDLKKYVEQVIVVLGNFAADLQHCIIAYFLDLFSKKKKNQVLQSRVHKKLWY